MSIPVPYRKWMIERWNKQKEREAKASNGDPAADVTRPLTEQERIKLIKKAKETNSKPPPAPSTFMQAQRNRK